jgi:MATE family multidrug resistance protein
MNQKAMNQKVWRIAGPLIISNISIPLLGAVDTAVVGHLPGPQYIGAVAVGAIIFTALYAGTSFLRMATVGLSAQARGTGDGGEVRAVLARAALFGAGIGLLIILLQLPLGWLGFQLIGAIADVEPLAREYFYIRVWAAPAAMMNIAIIGWLIGAQNTRASLWLYLLMNGLNAGLDLWFVIELGWGVAGVAWATLISQYVTLLLGIFIAARMLRSIEGDWNRTNLLDKKAFTRLALINRDIFIRSMFLQAALFTFTSLGARISTVVLAANAILMVFQHIMSAGIDGFAHTASALVGESIGEKSRKNFRAAVRITTLWSFCFSVFYSALFYFTGPTMIDFMTSLPEVRAATREYLPWMVITPLVGFASYQLDGFFIGATRGADMRNAMMVSVIIYALALAVLVPWLGNHGLWLGFIVLLIARTITLYMRFPKIEQSIEEKFETS